MQYNVMHNDTMLLYVDYADVYVQLLTIRLVVTPITASHYSQSVWTKNKINHKCITLEFVWDGSSGCRQGHHLHVGA